MSKLTAQRPEFILASGSPRRRELAAQVGLTPVVIKSDVPEAPQANETPRAYTQRLAKEKAQHVASELKNKADKPNWILSADTIVVAHDQILEKPQDAQHATDMLTMLSGTSHDVVTSFCWLNRATDEHRVQSVTTSVHFKVLPASWIEAYVRTGEPMGKAGSYAIQGLAGAFVEKINGSHSNVVGLPVEAVVTMLAEMGGIDDFPLVDEARPEQAARA